MSSPAKPDVHAQPAPVRVPARQVRFDLPHAPPRPLLAVARSEGREPPAK
jgi:hypothetical protein